MYFSNQFIAIINIVWKKQQYLRWHGTSWEPQF
ncbi:hypothetical protein NC652_029462 [Populus alba x Populus x berolinensis]|uniref:Uncharacterized protein n=1 Tax=Populus alba x Populus x berolinensis TaxID=444605 RepID=A0AAD6Q443_9ROSI|nr:hypothetical protein NC652_029462 [Populus alba x Populus x berolinensis]KAJ6977165.1 hypothetical protein NC653_029153 [Populus alba x Populus x berolinensis]